MVRCTPESGPDYLASGSTPLRRYRPLSAHRGCSCWRPRRWVIPVASTLINTLGLRPLIVNPGADTLAETSTAEANLLCLACLRGKSEHQRFLT